MNDARTILLSKIAAFACAIAVTMAAPPIEVSSSVADCLATVAPPESANVYDPWI